MAQQDMLFSDYLGVILRHKTMVLLVALLVAVATYSWTSREPPTYRSSARIKIQRIQTFTDMFSEVFISTGDPIENYVYELTSYSVMSRAAEVLGQGDSPRYLADLTGGISVERIGRTDLIDIFVTANAPIESQSRTVAVLAAFRDHHESIMSSNERKVKDFINVSREELDQLELKEEGLRQRLGIRLLLGAESVELRRMYNQLTEARTQLREMIEERRYTEKHPEVIAIRKNIEELEQKVEVLTRQELAVLRDIREYELYKSLVDEKRNFFVNKFEEAKIQDARRGEIIVEIEPPNPGRKISTGVTRASVAGALLGIMLGIILAFIIENFDTSFRTLTEIEEMFQLPILGIIPKFEGDDSGVPIHNKSLLEKIRYSDPVHSLARFAGFFPYLFWPFGRKRRSAKLRESRLVVPFYPLAPATEGYRTIRTNLEQHAKDSKIGAILFSSPGPAEGKTTTICNLAVAFAQAGKKTLLVGANMRRPYMYRAFGLKRERGLSEVIVGEMPWQETVKDYNDVAIGNLAEENLAMKPGMENLFFITCGGRTVQPSEWLSMPLFKSVIQEWEQEYDVILIDSPPLLPVPDSIIMARSVSKVVIVYRMGSGTSSDSVRRAIKALQKAGTQVKGIVLNGLHTRWASSADSFLYHGYYGRPDANKK